MKKSAKVSLGLMATVAASFLAGCGDQSGSSRPTFTPSGPASSSAHLPAEATPPGVVAPGDTRTSGTRSTAGTTPINRTHRTSYIPVPIGSSPSVFHGSTPLRSTPSRSAPSPRPSVSSGSGSPSRSPSVTRGGFGSTARSSSRISISS